MAQRVAGEAPRIRWYHFVLLGAIDVLGPFSTDSYVPNTTTMRKSLETTNVMTGLTLQLNWLSKGLATLWIGMLSDRAVVGRRGALLRTFVIYVVGTAGGFLTPTRPYGIYTLIFARAIQGIGESGTTVCTAVARDVLEAPDERLKVLTIISSLRLCALAVSPTIGGLVGDAFGWRSLFAALTCVGAFLGILTYFVLPETLHTAIALHDEEVKKDVDEGSFFTVLRRLFSDPDPDVGDARGSLFAVMFGFSGILCYLSNVSPILEEHYDVSVVTTALYMGSVAMIFVVASVVLSMLFARYKGASWLRPMALLKLSLRLRLLSMALLLISAFGPFPSLRRSVPALLANIYLYSIGIAVGFGAANTIFVQPFSGPTAGKATAIILITRTVVATSLSQLSIDVTDAFGVKGFYSFIAVIALGSQLAWLCFPRRGFYAVSADFPSDELTEHLLFDDDSDDDDDDVRTTTSTTASSGAPSSLG